MPKQNFISKEFFVNASEKDTQRILFTIPQHLRNIKLVSKHTPAHSIRFTYERPESAIHHHVDVSLLPLDSNFTSVCLHVSYSNGQVFYKDSNIINTLNNFEAAIQAALKGKLAEYEPAAPKVTTGKKMAQLMMMVVSSFSILFLKRMS